MPPLTDITWNIADSERVNGVAFSAVTAPAGPGVLSCAVYSPPVTNYSIDAVQFLDPPFPTDFYGGSILPDTYGAYTFISLTSGIRRSGLVSTILTMAGNVPQSAFTSFTINGFTLTSAGADDYQFITNTVWEWYLVQVMDTVQNYPITFI